MSREKPLLSQPGSRGWLAAAAGMVAVAVALVVTVTLTHNSSSRPVASTVKVATAPGSAGSSGSSGSSGPAAATSAAPSPSPTPPAIRLLSATPAGGASGISGTAAITLSFSAAVSGGSPMPDITPKVAGSWSGAGTDRLTFTPAVPFSQETRVTVSIPAGASGVRSDRGGVLAGTSQVSYVTSAYAPARLDQLLAQLGYLPLTWTAQAGVSVPAATDTAGQLAAAYSPPAGSYAWQGGYPEALHAFWDNGSPDGLIVKGAVMAFESDHGLGTDGVAGPLVWGALLQAVASGHDNPDGYTYAIASEGSPESLTIWHDGRVVQHSTANTGIQAAPTTIGTAPVYLRYRNQIMKGTNPDGTKYADPVQYVAYFRAGQAVHYFPRGSYGFPQSLGCVELDLADAAHAWPYLTYGTLVTVQAGSLTPAGSPRA